jgi:serine protease
MNRYIRLFSFLALLCAAFTAGANTSVSGFTDRIIIKMKSSQSSGSRFHSSSVSQSLSNDQVKTLGSSIGQSLKYSHPLANHKTHVMGLGGFQSIKQVELIAQQMMAANGDIEFVEPDYLMFPSSLEPNDPGFVDQWHLKGSPYQGLNLPAAWQHTTGSSDVVVAVVDTGILSDHPDFDPARILPGYDFVSQDLAGTFVAANDGDGRDANPADPGDWVSSAESEDPESPMFECPVSTSDWHGTHVAGTVGANTNNIEGMSGVDWAAKILPVRVLGKCGGYTSDIADGIIWAAGGVVSDAPINANPANVINLSLGTEGFCSFTMQAAIDVAFNSGASVVVAAGNESSSTAFVSPASCKNVIVVGAHDNQGHLSDFSNYGNAVDVLAPGGSHAAQSCGNTIISLFNAGEESPQSHGYGCLVGTSMAAPHVSGLIALMLSRNPDLTPIKIEELLKASAREYSVASGCSSSRCGAGIADAQAGILASAIPNAPDGLIAQNDNGTAQLSWQDNSALETGFKIEYSVNGGEFELAEITAADTTHYAHENGMDGNLEYRVSAVNGEFSSEASLIESVALPFKGVGVLDVLAASLSVNITWLDRSNYETGVEIYRAINDAEFQLLSTVTENIESYIDNDVEEGTFYRYKLRAIKQDAQTDFTESQQIEVGLLAPTALSGIIDGSLLKLSWQDNSNKESAYQVQRSIDNINYESIATLAANTESYSETSAPSTVYYYRVIALSDKSGSRSLQDLPAADSDYSNQILIEHKASSGSGAFSLLYVALLLVLSFYRRRVY